MVPADSSNVVMLRSGNLDRAQALALRSVLALVAEIDDALHAVDDGDIDSIFRAHRLVNRAIGIVLDHRLATSCEWRSSS